MLDGNDTKLGTWMRIKKLSVVSLVLEYRYWIDFSLIGMITITSLDSLMNHTHVVYIFWKYLFISVIFSFGASAADAADTFTGGCDACDGNGYVSDSCG